MLKSHRDTRRKRKKVEGDQVGKVDKTRRPK
jgi:hypothetical protein